MKAKRLLCIVLSLAAACSLMLVRDSAAWLDSHTGLPPTGTIKVGKMAFSFDGSLGTYLNTSNNNPYVVTEQNLIVTNGGRITVTNYSTVATEARFKITYDWRVPGSSNDGANAGTTETRTYRDPNYTTYPDSLSVTVGDHWVYNSQDGYFYYYRTLADAEHNITAEAGFAAVADNATTFTPVDAITEIKYLDELIYNGSDILQNKDYFTDGAFTGSVHVIFEAKQADNVSWSTITTWSTT